MADLPQKINRNCSYYEILLTSVLNMSNDSIILASFDGAIIEWNQKSKDIFKYDITKDSAFCISTILDFNSLDLKKINTNLVGNTIDLGCIDGITKDKKCIKLNVKHISLCIESKRMNLFIIQDISQHMELERRASENEDRCKSKDLFLATITHELRTPLHGIIGSVSLCRESQDNFTSEVKDLLDTIDYSANILLCSVNDILDYTKIECGEFNLNEKHFTLDKLVDKIMKMMKPLSQKKSHELTYNLKCDDPINMYFGDIERIEQIVVNLVNNSIKFTNIGGKIHIKIKSQKMDNVNRLTFNITDNGSGIPKKKIKMLFKPFIHFHDDYCEGTGLGLTICKFLAKRMNGDIKLVSTEEGVGTEFEFFVDLKIKMKRINSGNQRRRKSFIDMRTARMNIETTRPLNILLVEDNRINQKVTKKIINNMGHNCYIANDGVDAVQIVKHILGFRDYRDILGQKKIDEIEILKNEDIDIILMDINMPRKNGFEASLEIQQLYRKLRKQQPWIVALSATSVNCTEKILKDSMMNDFLLKPCKREDFEDIIANFRDYRAIKSKSKNRRISLVRTTYIPNFNGKKSRNISA